jgi:hypothetical protein
MRVNIIANVTTGVVVVWGLLSSIAVSVSCPTKQIIPSAGNEHCVGQVSLLKWSGFPSRLAAI